MGIILVIFYVFGNVEVLNELFIMFVIIDNMVGKLFLRIWVVILLWLGVLFKDKFLIIFLIFCFVIV